MMEFQARTPTHAPGFAERVNDALNPFLQPKLGDKPAAVPKQTRGVSLVDDDVVTPLRYELLGRLDDLAEGTEVAVHAVQRLDDDVERAALGGPLGDD